MDGKNMGPLCKISVGRASRVAKFRLQLRRRSSVSPSVRCSQMTVCFRNANIGWVGSSVSQCPTWDLVYKISVGRTSRSRSRSSDSDSVAKLRLQLLMSDHATPILWKKVCLRNWAHKRTVEANIMPSYNSIFTFKFTFYNLLTCQTYLV